MSDLFSGILRSLEVFRVILFGGFGDGLLISFAETICLPLCNFSRLCKYLFVCLLSNFFVAGRPKGMLYFSEIFLNQLLGNKIWEFISHGHETL